MEDGEFVRFRARVEELREKKAGLRRLYRYRARVIEQEIERIARQQEKERERQKNWKKATKIS